MPWKPTYTREEALEALASAATWSDALRSLGLAPLGKNYTTIRKWAERWNLDTSHLPPARPRGPGPRYTEEQAREAIASSRSWSEALRRLGYCPTGGNPGTLRAWASRWDISTEHFDPYAARRDALRQANPPLPLSEVLVEASTYSRGKLKQRLYHEGLKQPVCELCGQGELWQGRRMSLILDHANGIRNDNRLDNLRVVCPNCAATLDTHCGRKTRLEVEPKKCVRCDGDFRPKRPEQRYCSRTCGSRWDRRGQARPGARRAKRPPHDELLDEIYELGYSAVGRKYGVSDNAVRKWIREYERQRALAAGGDGSVVSIPKRTWPNQRNRRAA